ncbi:hypothetical protein GCM10023065_31430 [Microbacterium laevaniformans]
MRSIVRDIGRPLARHKNLQSTLRQSGDGEFVIRAQSEAQSIEPGTEVGTRGGYTGPRRSVPRKRGWSCQVEDGRDLTGGRIDHRGLDLGAIGVAQGPLGVLQTRVR